MQMQEVYHGTKADNILSIVREGLIRPNNGEIYFVKNESQLSGALAYGADVSRGARLALKVRIRIPDGSSLKPKSGPSAPADTWVLETRTPVSAEVVALYIQRRPGEPVEQKKSPAEIRRAIEALSKGFVVSVDRKISCAEGIIGELSVNGAFVCYTLELAWLWNEKNKSCIPPGKYKGILRNDHSDKWRIELTGVPGNREHVQIHIGNYPKDVKGCVLVGTAYQPDMVLNSAKAYEKLKNAYGNSIGPISVEFTGLLATPWGDYSGTIGKNLG